MADPAAAAPTASEPSTAPRAAVPAYAKLQVRGCVADEIESPLSAFPLAQGENFVYYIQTLSVTLGRKVAGSEDVDVDLGASKSISRVHARIQFDFNTRYFMLSPLGKNGVLIDGILRAKGSGPYPLETKYGTRLRECSYDFISRVCWLQLILDRFRGVWIDM